MDEWLVRVLRHFKHAHNRCNMPEKLKFKLINKTNGVRKTNYSFRMNVVEKIF